MLKPFAGLPALAVLIAACLSQAAISTTTRGLVESAESRNNALLVGVSHGLPGLDIDLENVKLMAEHPSYRYDVRLLTENDGTVENIARDLTAYSRDVDEKGTFLFYFTGHGNVGVICPSDRDMTVEEIRDALVAGREGLTPLSRLVLVFDSCHSGSLAGPLKHIGAHIAALGAAPSLADRIVRALAAVNRGGEYWEKLMVIASAQPDETCLASPSGSYFTNGLKEAFDETVTSQGTVGDLVRLAVEKTYGSTPMARLVPESLGAEPLVP